MDPELSNRLATHRDAIHHYILGMVRDATVADDLVQETFLRAHDLAP